MKKLNLLPLLMIGLVFMATSCEKDDLQNDLYDVSAKKSISVLEDCQTTVDLVAGRDHQVVGTVDVSIASDVVTVTYNTIGNWTISETHVHLFTDDAKFSDVPLTKPGNPKIGNFDFKEEHDFAKSVTVTIDNDVENIEIWEYLYVAAHAVVSKDAGLQSTDLPELVSFSVEQPGLDFGSPTYFDVTVSGGTSLDGLYDGFCVDTDRGIVPGEVYSANVYSTYGEFPANTLEFPENLDLVNWIINQDFTNQYSECTMRNYTYGDISFAIWMLLDDQTETSGLGEYDECAAQEIVDSAKMYGEGFIPGCGENMGILLIPTTANQRVMIWKTLECEGGEETAWGYGVEFPGKNWSMYFMACQ